MLSAQSVTIRYPQAGAAAVAGVSLGLGAGELLAVAGPNGSGKTTLLRGLLGTAPLDHGEVRLLGRPIGAWRRRELARVVAVVPQREETTFPLRVEETVMLGRYARLGPLARPSAEDHRAVEQALARCDVLGVRERLVDELSGGEWQRVRVARALAQEPRVLLLDEPTASLDVRHEMEVFELVRGLASGGLAVLVVTHHVNLAARFADRLLLLDRGSTVAFGHPADVLREDTVSRVFGWPVAVTRWRDGAPQVVPLRPGEVAPGAHSPT